ncbi:hypothetical protein [Caminibacter pacificus]|uniref:Uncharacterized protein n=1 Tax=Caminibacter pacificus TaxID=1424653 RepID=A0AAJ4UX53_9BACT|nr:hypothetical protein [Caminibacter pacificus]QDD68212.1 hypothetical protein C6V80_10175 [Caminibacter pacificus]ROR38726.1 hypothetical protein EDC58_1941 [Caminibacter pacificus]
MNIKEILPSTKEEIRAYINKLIKDGKIPEINPQFVTAEDIQELDINNPENIKNFVNKVKKRELKEIAQGNNVRISFTLNEVEDKETIKKLKMLKGLADVGKKNANDFYKALFKKVVEEEFKKVVGELQ